MKLAQWGFRRRSYLYRFADFAGDNYNTQILIWREKGWGGGGAKEGQTKFIMGDVQMANAWFVLKH